MALRSYSDLDSLRISAEFDGVRFDLERDPGNGLLEGSSVGDLADVWTHNSFAEPTSYAATFNANVLFTANYGRDRLGRIDSRSESAAGSSFSDVYAYETSGRLDTVHRSGGMASDYGFCRRWSSCAGSQRGKHKPPANLR